MTWFRVYYNVEINRQFDVEFVNGSPLGEAFWNPDVTEAEAQVIVEREIRSRNFAVLIADPDGSASRGFTTWEIGPVVKLDTAGNKPTIIPSDAPTEVDAAAVRGAG